MKFFIHYPQGRLGNLLFQINAIQHLAKENNAKAIVLACDASDFFYWEKEVIIVPCSKVIRKYLTKIWMCFLDFLCYIHFFGNIQPNMFMINDKYPDETKDLSLTEGLFKSIIIVKGFFQYDNGQSIKVKFNNQLMKNIDRYLVNFPTDKLVGVHMRFGDYNDWSIFGIKNTVLPISYYLKAFSLIENQVQPYYIVFSDDIAQAKEVMNQTGRQYKIFSAGCLIEDFAAMTMCSHFILSASSFSWWAAKLINNKSKILIAPMFWLGFRSNIWYPVSIKTKSFTYINVS